MNLPSLRTTTWVATAVAVALPLLSWLWWYGGTATLPGLFANFTASFFAFLIALAWDRKQRRAEADDAAAERKERLKDEAARRFLAIDVELASLGDSIDSVLRDHRKAKYFLPDFPTGSWEAGREHLGLIIGDYLLIANLATLYARVEDLQWRLRTKARIAAIDAQEAKKFDPMIDAIARAARSHLDRLQPLVKEQIENPQLLPATSLRLVPDGMRRAREPVSGDAS